MKIAVIRIDDRLIHGQVVVGWVPALEIRDLVVVNDLVAANKGRREMMALGVPNSCRAHFLTVADSVKQLDADLGTENAMLLFENPSDVLAYIQSGATANVVNIGGMHFAEGKREIHNGYFASDKDLAVLKGLADLKIALEIRALPGQNPVNLNHLLSQENA